MRPAGSAAAPVISEAIRCGGMPHDESSTSATGPEARMPSTSDSCRGISASPMSSIGWQKGQWPMSCTSAAAMKADASSGPTAVVNRESSLSRRRNSMASRYTPSECSSRE